MLGERFKEAVGVALDAHATQMRKGTPVPYVSHLLGVCATVLANGGNEDEAIAALLHDTLEDQPDKVTAEEIEAKFGRRVREIVEFCTDTSPGYTGGPKGDWKERKKNHLERFRRADKEMLTVPLADKLENARAILADYRKVGDELWRRFAGRKDGVLWYYGELLEALGEAGAGGQVYEELKSVVSDLKREVAENDSRSDSGAGQGS